jgi:nigerose phosphorylase
MLHLFKNRFSKEVIRANWDYYEPRSEHGSSLSPCVYALVAAHIGYTEWAYRYFLKTATVDLTGLSKQYVGTLYIGGTHPAANGGAWMAATLGFAGFQSEGDTVTIQPALPEKWESLAFRFHVKGQQFSAVIDRTGIVVESVKNNRNPQSFQLFDRSVVYLPGERVDSRMVVN